MTETIHVLLADDHDLVRGGLKAALRNFPEFSVVAEARDGEEAVREADLVVPQQLVEGTEHRRAFRHRAPVQIPQRSAHADDDFEVVRSADGSDLFAALLPFLVLLIDALDLRRQGDGVDFEQAVHAGIA
ncbi:DNA-binding response regulator, partial [bacterium]